MLPENAPTEYSDRAVLWNAAEKIEKAKNSQLAREIELALPVELPREQNISLVREYVKNNFVDKGMCADICIHDKNDGNPHAHIIRTERGDMNRNIENINKELRQVRERIRKAKDWLYSQPIENAPTFVSIMSSIADSKNLNSRWQKIASLKTQAKILMFLQNNNITDMTHLVDKVTKMNEDFYDVSETIKKVNRRLENLSQHLEQYGNYKVNKPTYDKYKQLDPKKQEAFYNKHSDEIELFKTSQQYLTAIMNGKTTIPEKSWQKEQKNLTKHRFSLYEKFYGLKDEIRNVELLRKGAENIMNEDKQEIKHTRTQGMEF